MTNDEQFEKWQDANPALCVGELQTEWLKTGFLAGLSAKEEAGEPATCGECGAALRVTPESTAQREPTERVKLLHQGAVDFRSIVLLSSNGDIENHYTREAAIDESFALLSEIERRQEKP